MAVAYFPFAAGRERLRRVGVLLPDAPETEHASRQRRLLRDAFTRVGREEGRGLSIEWRHAGGRVGRLNGLAEELAGSNVDVIVAVSNDAIAAAKRATRSVPIVMAIANLPVESGFVESLSRPGGNVTGVTWISSETVAKQLQFLNEAVPEVARIAVLWDPTYPANPIYRREYERAGIETALGISLHYVDAARPDEIDSALGRIGDMRPDALYVVTTSTIRSRLRDVARFAIEHRMVSIGSGSPWVLAGGLYHYGPGIDEMWDLVARCVDRILRGARPMQLPIESPGRYELLINRATAAAIGYAIPPHLLLRADRVVE